MSLSCAPNGVEPLRTVADHFNINRSVFINFQQLTIQDIPAFTFLRSSASTFHFHFVTLITIAFNRIIICFQKIFSFFNCAKSFSYSYYRLFLRKTPPLKNYYLSHKNQLKSQSD